MRSTNLTVVTDRRMYYFRLTATTPRDKRDATYLLRFHYPPEGEIAVNPAAVRKPIGQQAKEDKATRVKVRNCHYSVSGSQNIQMVRACDDGHLPLPGVRRGTNYPAFFAGRSGRQRIGRQFPNGRQVLVIERVGSLFTLRDGNEALCLSATIDLSSRGEAKPRTSIKFKGKS